ncbi:ankyrin repeat domain-containing protein [Endozoicomonas euniceicola]|uniref:Ankyrin repeat domain-containing protein n=1 Tax=Endozoicomonas euniceicola TaxID=1234143 RepID=A0ABY6GUP3_9GAMM|nr:ankyrin repeat domain-containing protein [Endozoicomonas euniceicola]UYM16497.1 ankyrin repeat domain-containing protein [Endozoicomonas euniceicola]
MDAVAPSPSPVSVPEEGVCHICFLDFHGREVTPVIVTPQLCGHRYDLHCITGWFEGLSLDNRVCCLCRKKALPLKVVSGVPDEESPFIQHEALEAVYQGNTEKLASMLTIAPELALRFFHDPVIDKDITLLHAAAWKGKADCLQVLINAGANIDISRHSDGITPAFVAAANGKTDCLKALIEAGANVDIPRFTDGATPTLIAVQNLYLDSLQVLIEAGANVDIPRHSDGATPVLIAVEKGFFDYLNPLIEAGADLNAARHTDGATPIFIAAHEGNICSLGALIKGGANLNAARHTDGATPAVIAAREGYICCLKELIEAGAEYEEERCCIIL